MNKVINIGRDFSENPAGRTIELDGDDSGEAFRENVLKPALDTLEDGDILEIVLDDGVISYGSSFISEAFGKLVSSRYATAKELEAKLKFTHAPENAYMSIAKTRILRSIEKNTPE